MNWKYLIGKNLSKLDSAIVNSGYSFVYNNYPFGRNWMFDLKKTLKCDPTLIVDAGANIGSVSKELNNFFRKATIFSFEPVKSTFNLLVEKTKASSKIIPIQFALAKSVDRFELFLSSENTINSLKSKQENDSIGKEIIQIIRLDNFLLDKNLNKVDVLKIDVEGFEFEVLKGCENIEIDCILLEVGYERESTKVHFSDVEIYMEERGYQLCGIYEIMRNLNDKRKIAYSNNLYIKKELLL